jgi:hypothetical protein
MKPAVHEIAGKHAFSHWFVRKVFATTGSAVNDAQACRVPSVVTPIQSNTIDVPPQPR